MTIPATASSDVLAEPAAELAPGASRAPTAAATVDVIAGLSRTAAEARPGRLIRGSANGPDPAWARRLPGVVVALVAAIAAGLAVAMFLAHAAAPGLLFVDVQHDRNGHFGFGLDLALALRGGDLVAFVSQLAKAMVWPPLHGLLLSTVLAIAGPDARLAILPSLLGWTATVTLTAALAARLFTRSADGNSSVPAMGSAMSAAGAVAAATAGGLALSSPAFALLGSDVMLEALGAALSALALLCFARAMDAPDNQARWRALGIVLTLLFFHKGNYWGLVLVSLGVAFAIERRATIPGLLRSIFRAIATRGRPAAALRHSLLLPLRDPLLLAAGLLVALIAAIYRHGPAAIDVFGRSVSLYPPENLVTVAYALLFARAVLAWREFGPVLAPALGVPGRAVLAWHVLPVAVSFLIPKRLSAFLWFVGPSNAPAGAGFDPLHGAARYAAMAAEGFFADPTVAMAALALALVGFAGWKQYPPGGRAVFVLAVIAAVAVAIHPHQQARFLASWVFAWWVAAGAGAGVLVGLAAGRWPMPRTRAALGAALAVAVLAAAVLLSAPPSEAARAAAIRGSGPSSLSLVAPALPALAGARAIGVAATTGRTPFFAWAIHVACRCGVPVDSPWFSAGASRGEVQRAVTAWLATTPADRLLVVDVPVGPPAAADQSAPEPAAPDPDQSAPNPGFAGFLDAMAAQARFVPLARFDVPEHGAVVSVWGRGDTALPPAPAPAAPASAAPPPAPPAPGQD